MKIEITGGRVFVDGDEFIRKDVSEATTGEVLTIKEVRPIYGEGFSWLQLGFESPHMKFSPNDKIRIVKL